jgi:guanylate kinase
MDDSPASADSTPLAANRGKLVLIIGPSGAGKSVILKRLKSRHPEFHFPRSATTRVRRPGEGDELYLFVTDEEFDRLIGADAFIETAVVHGGPRYGTLKQEILPHIERGKTVVREVDVQGFDSIRLHPLFAADRPSYRLQSIFIMPENKEQLISRITNRAPISDEELHERLRSMEQELRYADLCTHSIVNRDGALDATVAAVEQSITEQ